MSVSSLASYLIWSQNGVIVRGANNGVWINGSLVFPISYPGQQSATEIISLQNSASAAGNLETFQNVKLYLDGDPGDLAIVQGLWPVLGNAYSPARTEMNGGLDISFDGVNFTRFSNTVGLKSDPSTWLTLPAISMGEGAADGILGAFEVAQIYVRYTIPSVASTYKTFNIQLAADVDIV